MGHFFGGFLGGLVCIMAEVRPDASLLRHAYQGYGRDVGLRP